MGRDAITGIVKMARPQEFPESTIYLLQKLLPAPTGRQTQIIVGYTTDWDWAEKWRSREPPSHPRFVVPVKKMEGAP